MIDPGETREEDVETKVFAKVNPIGRDEYAAAGEKGMKARYMFEVYMSEYNDQSVVVFGEDRLTVYRTYGPKDDDKIEVYAGQRVGNR